MGVTGLEQAFSALHHDLVLPGVLSLETLVERMTCGGEPFGIDAPRVKAGAPANLVLIDPAQEWVVGEEGYESRSFNSCFAGRTLTGRVLMTVAAGQVAFRQRAFAIGRRRELPRIRGDGGVSIGRLDRERAALVVVDVQEGFRKAVPEFEQVATATGDLDQRRRGDGGARSGHRAVPEGPR